MVITPPVGVDLHGYAGREGPAVGVHDDLYCRALVLDDGLTRLALMAFDLLGIDFDLDRALRTAVGEAAGLPPDNVLLNCSHTHAGPAVAGLAGMGEPNASYLAELRRRAAECAAAAAAKAAPASLRLAAAPLRAGINRRERGPDGVIRLGRNPAGLCDQSVRVLSVDAADGRPAAILFHHACHGTTLGGDNRLITAEWMGAACRRIAERVDGAVPMFFQGCCGAINPDAAQHSFEEVERIGADAAAAVLSALDTLAPIAASPLAARLSRVELPLVDPPHPDAARADLAKAQADVKAAQESGAHPYWVRALGALVSRAERILEMSERGVKGQTLPFAVQAMRVGDLGIAALSGEVFLEFAHEIERQSPAPHTLVLGYSNGCTGYVPTAEAMAEGGYEARESFGWYGTLPLAPSAGAEMVAAALRALGDLWRQP